MLIERIVMTLVTLARAISLDVFRPRRDASRHVFMDIYVQAWAVLLGVSLTFYGSEQEFVREGHFTRLSSHW
jgi:hypothetical protein